MLYYFHYILQQPHDSLMLRMYKIPSEKKVEKNGVQNTFGKATCCQKGKFLKYDKLELTDYLLPDFNIFIAYLNN